MSVGLLDRFGHRIARASARFDDQGEGSRFEGPGGGDWLITPAGDHRLAVEASAVASEAAAVIRSSADAFVVWGTKRVDWRDYAELEGDLQLASRFLDTLNIV